VEADVSVPGDHQFRNQHCKDRRLEWATGLPSVLAKVVAGDEEKPAPCGGIEVIANAASVLVGDQTRRDPSQDIEP
jgi:hypothetical protein